MDKPHQPFADGLPNLSEAHAELPPAERVQASTPLAHAPRFLILYGSLRERSFSRFLAYEAARLLEAMGGELRIFHAHGLPLPDNTTADHPKVRELRELSVWSEGQVWVSPERHGNLTGVMKSQIDWLPLSEGSVRPTQGRTLAVMQVSGGSQSFNAVNSLRVLGRWMRMITIPNQSSVPMAYKEFDEAGRMRPGPLYDRVVDVCEELMKFTLLTRGRADYLVDRYSERKERDPDRLKAVAADVGFVRAPSAERAS
ncbi:arsenical resistance protein ArsH [Methylorubrum extorquens]|uniref:arsenical resistance protein ArsH n=1 Tax=Methylorubrum extorquens TaxID=408 RepID=UPI000158F0EA|nr:arsenical resistance protein ArsH [Methylorubrum extorquens]ABY32235.1 arsenical resistance protein ArsH [Methylorubrum extorquens PA1]KQP92876.1 NADPH-dependent FMN reductase [Methylobacterium sp. Leaf119]WIU38842.1 arsenical resistance protein ArsH [Methylorubrum extorquens]